MNLYYQLPDDENYRLQRNPQQSDVHAEYDAFWQEEHVQTVDWQLRVFDAKIICILHTIVLRLNWLLLQNHPHYQVPVDEIKKNKSTSMNIHAQEKKSIEF